MQLCGDQRARKTREKKSVVSEARRSHKDRPLIDEERAAAAVIKTMVAERASREVHAANALGNQAMT